MSFLLKSHATKVKIVEVGPRDGLQNEIRVIPTKKRIQFINFLLMTGLSFIEAASFVSPKKVPQMENSDEIIATMSKESNIYTKIISLVPNLKGLIRAEKAGSNHIAVFTTASEAFSQRNIGMSVNQSLNEITKIFTHKAATTKVRGYISCIFDCPYQGKIESKDVTSIAAKLLEMGCYEISLGDTIGTGSSGRMKMLLQDLKTLSVQNKFAGHFHDTYGQGLVNVLTCLEAGITSFDSSIGGLGGCPFAKGATGNIATEELIYLMHDLNIDTGIDLKKIEDVIIFLKKELEIHPRSKYAQALLKKRDIFYPES